MKKFVVSEKCIACGNCLLETKLLQEDAEGKAVPVNGGYFSDDFYNCLLSAAPCNGIKRSEVNHEWGEGDRVLNGRPKYRKF